MFVDSDHRFVDAAAVLPSGQLVTTSEITARLLADVENDRTIIAPAGIKAMEYLIPACSRSWLSCFCRTGIARYTVLTRDGFLLLLLFEAGLLFGLHVRIDLGRPILIFVGVAILSAWLVVDVKKNPVDAFKKGSTFWPQAGWNPRLQNFVAVTRLKRLPRHVQTVAGI